MHHTLKTNVDQPTVTRHNYYVFFLVRETNFQTAFQTGSHRIGIPVITINEWHGSLGNCQSAAPGGADNDRVLGIGHTNINKTDVQGHCTARTHGMFFNHFLEFPHICYFYCLSILATAVMVWAMFHQVFVFNRQKLFKCRRRV